MDEPIEVQVAHRCFLAALVDELSSTPADVERASRALARLVADPRFHQCCVPRYLAVAPPEFPREVQVPVAERGGVDARVLLWPIGARDRTHPHADGWAVLAVVAGDLVVAEWTDDGQAERQLSRGEPEILVPEDAVRHRVTNRGDEVGLSVHLFGPTA